VFTRSDRLRPNTKFSRLSGTESDKSFVDDFDMELVTIIQVNHLTILMVKVNVLFLVEL